jgi:serine/threonine-protein kinase RsbT
MLLNGLRQALSSHSNMDFPPVILTRSLVTVISEITRNVVQHAGCSGEIQIGQVTDGDKNGLRIIVSDKGKGIEQPERFLENGKAGLGSGLPGSRSLVDQFHLESALGTGTTITMDFWQRKVTP